MGYICSMADLIFRKQYIKKLLAYKDIDLIKVVTGLRRSGKSTLLTLYRTELKKLGVQPSQMVSLNFEEFELRKFLNDLDGLYAHIIGQIDLSKPCYVFLDEVQNVKEFERLVDGLFVKNNVDVYITGSNAHLLSGELATLLSGRYIELSILPFSFNEYLTARQIDISNKYLNYELLFFDFINETSMPKGTALRELGYDKIYEYLEAIYNTIIEKDITQRHQINDKRAFGNIIKFVASNIGNSLSPGNIATALKKDGQIIHNTTVEKYLEYLVTSFVFYKVNRFDLKGKKQLATQEKYYLVDLGLKNITATNKYDSDLGRKLENVVYFELLRRGGKIYVGKNNDKEIDFVVQKPNNEREYYQVAHTVNDEKTFNREISAFRNIRDNYPKFLLTLDYDNANIEGVQKTNVIDWLLQF